MATAPACLWALSLLLFACLASARVPPAIPGEYMCNVEQHKWNNNGAAVNHHYLLTWYQSVQQQLMRVDGIFFGNQNASDPSLGIQALQQISIIDFSRTPPLNTYSERYTLLTPFNCTLGPATYLMPDADFLNETNAIWAGDQGWPGGQVVQAWTSFALPGDAITFYFTNDTAATLLGWDLQQQALLTGVQTRFFNCIWQTPPAWFFEGSGSKQCTPVGADARGMSKRNPTLFFFDN